MNFFLIFNKYHGIIFSDTVRLNPGTYDFKDVFPNSDIVFDIQGNIEDTSLHSIIQGTLYPFGQIATYTNNSRNNSLIINETTKYPIKNIIALSMTSNSWYFGKQIMLYNSFCIYTNDKEKIVRKTINSNTIADCDSFETFITKFKLINNNDSNIVQEISKDTYGDITQFIIDLNWYIENEELKSKFSYRYWSDENLLKYEKFVKHYYTKK